MKPLIIVGPTSSGKTDLSLWIAKHLHEFHGSKGVDILVMDSKQVYRGQDIVTGKDLEKKFKVKKTKGLHSYFSDGSTRIFGIDLVDPDEEWSVAQSVEYADEIIYDAKAKNRLLIIVSGTPQYLLSVFDPPMSVFVRPDVKLRAELEMMDLLALQSKLEAADTMRYRSMNNSDKNNPRRLIRAIEVACCEQTLPKREPTLLISDCAWIGLSIEKADLQRRIAKRVEKRMEQGAVGEYTRLKDRYPSWKKEAFTAIGYTEIESFVEGRINQASCVNAWTLHEVQYAKRQMTWWKREHQIVWFDALEASLNSHVLQHLKSCYNETT